MNIQYTFNTLLPNGRILFFREGQSVTLDGSRLIDHPESQVISIAIMSEVIVIIADDPDIYNSPANSYKEDRQGNLFAYDFNGRLLWSIDDIINEELHYPFFGGSIVTSEKKELFSKWKNVSFVDGHEYYIAYNNADANYIIDITDSVVIAKRVYRG